MFLNSRPLRESGFADGRSATSPDSEQMEQTVTMLHLLNSVSVEQIQDREYAFEQGELRIQERGRT